MGFLSDFNKAAAAFLDKNVGRPDFLKSAPTPKLFEKQLADAGNIGALALGLSDGHTEAAGKTQAERDAQMREAQRANETNAAVNTGTTAVIGVYDAAGKKSANLAEGLDELATGRRSDAILQAVRDTDERVHTAVAAKDDTALMKEYHAQVTKRMERLEERFAEARGNNDAAALADAMKQMEATKVLQAVQLEPGKTLSDEQRKEIAKTTKVLSGSEALSEMVRLGSVTQEAGKFTEDSLIMSAQIVANIAAPGVGGLVITQAVGIADQTNMLGKPIDTGSGAEDNRQGGAISKLVTGNGKDITWGNVVDDGIDIVFAAIPGGNGASNVAKEGMKKAEREGLEVVAKATVEEIAHEMVEEGVEKASKKAGTVLAAKITDAAKDQAGNQVQDVLKDGATSTLETLTGTSRLFRETGRTTGAAGAKAAADPMVSDRKVVDDLAELKGGVKVVSSAVIQQARNKSFNIVADFARELLVADLDSAGKAPDAPRAEMAEPRVERAATVSEDRPVASAPARQEKPEVAAAESARKEKLPERKRSRFDSILRIIKHDAPHAEGTHGHNAGHGHRTSLVSRGDGDEAPVRGSRLERNGAMRQLQGGHRNDGPREAMGGRHRPDALAVIDTDGNGKITKEEAVQFISNLDSNHDGKVGIALAAAETGINVRQLGAALRGAGVEVHMEGRRLVAEIPQVPHTVAANASKNKSNDLG